tara:strand:+ start:71 stop:820 length:750 start_codon:yes stop_codon:yes gene_type:complete
MKLFNKIFIFYLFFLLYSCADYKVNKKSVELEKNFFSSSGFALIYDENLYQEGLISKKIKKDEIIVYHSFLKKNTPIKIINPENSKIISTKINGRANYPDIFVVTITKKVAEMLDLDLENPFVEILETKKNETFIAKEGKTFDEEKNVADKAPIEKIEIDDLSKKDEKKNIKKKQRFIILISDFYYLDSAENLKDELVKKTKLEGFVIKKINNKKYRLYIGPFQNFNSLKSTYISLNKLGFAELNVYKE